MTDRLSIQRADKLKEIKAYAKRKNWTVVTEIYEGCTTKIEFKCEENHSFSMKSNKINRGDGCSTCSGQSTIVTAKRFYKKIKEMKGFVAKNSYKTMYKDVTITCEKNHTWITTPLSIHQGYWCKMCLGKCPIENFKNNLARKKFKTKSSYISSSEKIDLTCEKGHDFVSSAGNLRSSRGCPVCAERCPKEAAKLFYQKVKDRGGVCTDEYINSVTLLEIVCSKGHTFKGRPDLIKADVWCPQCNESKGELHTAAYLTKLNIPFVKQFRLPESPLRKYDFMATYKGAKIIIEFDGKFHFEQGNLRSEEEFKTGRKNDIEKTELAIKTHKMRMIRDHNLLRRRAMDPFENFISSALDDRKMLVVSKPEMYDWLEIDRYNEVKSYEDLVKEVASTNNLDKNK